MASLLPTTLPFLTSLLTSILTSILRNVASNVASLVAASEQSSSTDSSDLAPTYYTLLAFLHLSVAHCHCPNYNFYGAAYYSYASLAETVFPSVGEGWKNAVEGLRLCGIAEKVRKNKYETSIVSSTCTTHFISLTPQRKTPRVPPCRLSGRFFRPYKSSFIRLGRRRPSIPTSPKRLPFPSQTYLPPTLNRRPSSTTTRLPSYF